LIPRACSQRDFRSIKRRFYLFHVLLTKNTQWQQIISELIKKSICSNICCFMVLDVN
jgi:hypothetical protein